jgi:hypothetical protein
VGLFGSGIRLERTHDRVLVQGAWHGAQTIRSGIQDNALKVVHMDGVSRNSPSELYTVRRARGYARDQSYCNDKHAHGQPPQSIVLASVPEIKAQTDTRCFALFQMTLAKVFAIQIAFFKSISKKKN